MPGSRSSWRAGWAAAGLGAGLVVAACGQVPSLVTAKAPATSSPTPAAGPGVVASDGSPSRPTAPLTGLPAAGAAAAARPAVALVVAGAHPVGLSSADVVFEEATAPVRYIAVYQSRQASAVGPITGTQPTDRQALSVLHPLFGYDGSVAPFFLKSLEKANLKDVGYANDSSLYHQTTSQGVMVSTAAIMHAGGGKGGAPPPMFLYRGGGGALAATGVSRVSSVRVATPGNGTQEWVFDQRADRWALTGWGQRIRVANLVVQAVDYKKIGVNRRLGIVVPTARVIGTGRAEVFSGTAAGKSGGTAVTGTWSKPKPRDVTNYFDASGALMAFQPGPTWVILAPPGTRVSTGGK